MADVPGARQIDANQIAPSPDFDDFAIGTDDFDVSSIGGYPVRLIEVVAGSGTLKVKTKNSFAKDVANSTTTWRSPSGLVPGSKVGPGEIVNIAGTTNGSTAGFTLRIYK